MGFLQRKLGLLPAFVAVGVSALGLLLVLASMLVLGQRDIHTMARQAQTDTFPLLDAQVRVVINLNRLKASGDIVGSTDDAQERQRARAIAQVLSIDSIFDQDPQLKESIGEVWAAINTSGQLREAAAAARGDAGARMQVLIPAQRLLTQALGEGRFGGDSRERLFLGRLMLFQSAIDQYATTLGGAQQAAADLLEALHALPPAGLIRAAVPTLDERVHGATAVPGLLERAHALDAQAQSVWQEKATLISAMQQRLGTSAVQSAERTFGAIAERAQQSQHTAVAVAVAIGLLVALLGLLLHLFVVRPLVRAASALAAAEAGDAVLPRKDEPIRELDAVGQAAQLLGHTLVGMRQRTKELAAANTELEAQRHQLEALAITDPLTGTFNRRRFFDLAGLELARLRRNGGKAALLMLDLDHFKAINDTHGHATGDTALCAVATQAAATLREGDVLARIGGEEFAVLLHNTDRAQAMQTGERLRLAVEHLAVASSNGVLQLTVSIGLTLLHAADTDVGQALARADAMLYTAKQRGRNRVEADSAAP